MIERLTPAEIMSTGQVDIAHALQEDFSHWHIVSARSGENGGISLCGVTLDLSRTYYKFTARPNQGMYINKYCPKCLDARIAELIEMLRNELNYV